MNRKTGPVWYRLVANQWRGDLILAWAKCPLHPSAVPRGVSGPSVCAGAVSHCLRWVGLRGQAKLGEPACCLLPAGWLGSAQLPSLGHSAPDAPFQSPALPLPGKSRGQSLIPPAQDEFRRDAWRAGGCSRRGGPPAPRWMLWQHRGSRILRERGLVQILGCCKTQQVGGKFSRPRSARSSCRAPPWGWEDNPRFITAPSDSPLRSSC